MSGMLSEAVNADSLSPLAGELAMTSMEGPLPTCEGGIGRGALPESPLADNRESAR
jgi:hypothetical protein